MVGRGWEGGSCGGGDGRVGGCWWRITSGCGMKSGRLLRSYSLCGSRWRNRCESGEGWKI